MKKIYYILLTFFFISLASCNFFLGEQLIKEDDNKIFEYDYEETQEKPGLVLTGSIKFSGAIPFQLLPSETTNARTAIPTAPASYVYKYQIDGDAFTDLTVTGGTYSIVLPRKISSVSVTVRGYTSASAVNPLLEGTLTIPATDYSDTITEDIELEPYFLGKGTVKLAVKTEVSTVVRCFANWIDPTDGSNMLFQELDLSSGSAYFTMDSAEVRSGAHEVEFIFQNAGNNVVYRCKEKINIFSTLETNKWLDNGSIHIDTSAEDGKGALRINQTCLDIFTRHDFYVSNSPDSQGTGTYFDPVNFEDAVRFINSVNDGTSQYTIYVKSSVAAAADYSDWPTASGTPADSYITIDPASNLKLKICSYGTPVNPYKIDAKRSVDYPGRVMYIGEKAEVTLENITVTGGCSTNNGAGVYVNSGALYLNSKASVSYNKMAAASKYAAGVYNNKGTLSLGNGSEISYNGDETFLPNAGGLYSQNGKFYMEPGSEVHHNYAYSGAGVKLNKPVDGYIHGAKIYSNEIKGASGNGGGLFVSSTNFVFEIKDTEIYSNKAYKGAGALVQNALFNGTTIFKENEAYTGGGGLYSSDLEITVTENVVFENNKAPDGSAIYVENKVAKNELSDSFKFVNTTELQTVFLEYDTAAETPVITLGNLTGTAANQKINLIINKKSEGNYVAITVSDVGVQIISPADGSVDLSAYVGNIAILNNDLTASGYKIDSNGKLVEKAVVGPNGGNGSSAYTVVSTIEACGGTLPAAGVYSLSTEAELEQISTWAAGNTLSGFTFVLYDNIPMTSANFTPIGGSTKFAGTFDGNGNKITNLKINKSSGNIGLFGTCGRATIKNLYVEGTITGSGTNIGGIAGSLTVNLGSIENCVSNIKIINTTGNSVGGICGDSSGVIKNCVNLGDITGSSTGINAAGICGYTAENIYNCVNFGHISGYSGVAGIVGQINASYGVKNCYNYGTISASTENKGAIVGTGISGNPNYAHLYYHANSETSSAISGTSYPGVGETFTDPDVLRSTLNENITANYGALGLNDWNYDYKIDGVKFPVCTTFVLPEKIGVNLSDLASAPSDNSVPYIMKTQDDIEKLAGWVNSGLSFDGFEFKIPEEVSTIALSGNWTPIGTSTNPFRGIFDGGNVKISSVSVSGSNYRGFFGYIDGATIKNLTIEGSLTVTGSDCGGLVGYAKGNVVIDNCDVKMAITGNNSGARLGGILGNYDGTSSTCLYIQNCINRGTVSGGSNAGGVAGYIYSYAISPSYIYNCANYGGVTGAQGSVGGIAGSVTNTVVENCLCDPAGSISGLDSVGKICGKATANSELNYCYYLDYSADSENYKGTTAGTTLNCNVFRVMDTKYQVYNTGYSATGTYSADADLCDIMNDWVNNKNTTSPGYLKWKYESSLMEFIE